MRMIDADALDKLLSYTEVEALKKWRHYMAGVINGIRASINEMVSAEPEQKTGKWIDIDKEIRSIKHDIAIYEERIERYKSNPTNGMVDSQRLIEELEQNISDAKKEIRMLNNIYIQQGSR